MKRILCFIFCVLMLVSVCSLPALAADEPQKSVMEDLSTLYIDGKQFNEADYPLDPSDKNMYILTVVEKGFLNTSSSPDFALYIYVYNPSGLLVKDKLDNSVQIGVNADCTEYSFYGLRGQSVSADRRFIRFKVESYGTNSIVNLYKNQKQANERVYNVACLRLYVDSGMQRFKTVKTFYFKGFDHNGTLESEKCDMSALDVELYTTNWISPNAGTKVDGSAASIYDHYEINSVYFTLPESYFEDGYYLASIRAVFDKLRLTPIVVTNTTEFHKNQEGEDTKYLIEQGWSIFDWSAKDFYDLYVEPGLGEQGWVFSESWGAGINVMGNRREFLAYYFESDLIPEDFDFDYGVNSAVAVSSEALKAYFYERVNNPDYDDSKLYESKELFELDYTAGKMLQMSTYTSDLSSFEKWFLKISQKNDSYLFEDFDAKGCEEFSVIGGEGDYNLDYYINLPFDKYAEAANELYIGRNDMVHFKNVCQNAKNNGERVVILRFGFSDYTCRPLYDAWEVNIPNFQYFPQVGFAINKYAFMSVSLSHLVFRNGVQSVVVPVVSDVVDSFGNLTIFEDPNDDNPLPDKMEDPKWWEELLEKIKELLAKLGQALKVTGIVLLAVAVVWIGVKVWLWIRGVRLVKKLQDKDKERLNDHNRKE